MRTLSRWGFTLVELLVVIGIIGVLIGLLLPVLGKARESANFTKCRANLQQISLATRLYSNDFNDYLPGRDEVGGWYYRRAPGEVNSADPYSVPERYGLGALYQERGYIRGDTAVWLDPSANETLQSYKNTYAHAILTESQRSGIYRNSKTRGKSGVNQGWFVYCNMQYRPYPRTGAFKGPTDSSTGLTIPSAQQIPTHPYRLRTKQGTQRTGAINVMFVDGVVGSVVFNLGGNQAGTIVRGE